MPTSSRPPPGGLPVIPAEIPSWWLRYQESVNALFPQSNDAYIPVPHPGPYPVPTDYSSTREPGSTPDDNKPTPKPEDIPDENKQATTTAPIAAVHLIDFPNLHIPRRSSLVLSRAREVGQFLARRLISANPYILAAEIGFVSHQLYRDFAAAQMTSADVYDYLVETNAFTALSDYPVQYNPKALNILAGIQSSLPSSTKPIPVPIYPTPEIQTRFSPLRTAAGFTASISVAGDAFDGGRRKPYIIPTPNIEIGVPALVPPYIGSPRYHGGTKPDILFPGYGGTVAFPPDSTWTMPGTGTAVPGDIPDYVTPGKETGVTDNIPPVTAGLGLSSTGALIMRITHARTKAAAREYARAEYTRRHDTKPKGNSAYLAAQRIVSLAVGNVGEAMDFYEVLSWNLMITPENPIVLMVESFSDPGEMYRVRITEEQPLATLPVKAQAEFLRQMAAGNLGENDVNLDISKFGMDLLRMQLVDIQVANQMQFERRVIDAAGLRGPLDYGNFTTWIRRIQRVTGNED